jgi:heme exporter protein D
MSQLILALNKLGKVDTAFICICAAIVVAIVAIYFLIPVFRKAQYQQQIESLRAREAAIKASRQAGLSDAQSDADTCDALPQDDTVDTNDTTEDSTDVSEDVAE